MTASLYLLLIIDTFIAFLLVYLLGRLFARIENRYLAVSLFIIKVILTLYLGLALIAFAYKVVWRHEYPFAALYLALIPSIASDIICFLWRLLRKDRNDKKISFVVSAALTAAFTLYSIVNMQTISPNYHEISSAKLSHEYRLVFFSDLHYGSSQSRKTVDTALDEIKGLKPDYLLLGGDITDENTTKEEMEYLYRKIGSLGIPVRFIYGNHDRQERGEINLGMRHYTEAELERCILENGIEILYEDYERVNDDLVLLGREDPSHPEQRKTVKDLPALPENSYVVAIDHTPYQTDEMIELKADLQLSGHTHAGQFFPIETVYKIIGLNVFGDYYIGDTHLYVSSGIAGWYLPLRSEGHCNYEVFDLKPE